MVLNTAALQLQQFFSSCYKEYRRNWQFKLISNHSLSRSVKNSEVRMVLSNHINYFPTDVYCQLLYSIWKTIINFCILGTVNIFCLKNLNYKYQPVEGSNLYLLPLFMQILIYSACVVRYGSELYSYYISHHIQA